MFRNMSIGNKVSLILTLALLIGNIWAILLVSLNIKGSMLDDAKRFLMAKASSDTQKSEEYFNVAGAGLQSMAKAIEARLNEQEVMSPLVLKSLLGYIVDYDQSIVATYVKIQSNLYDEDIQEGMVFVDDNPQSYNQGINTGSIYDIRSKDGKNLIETFANVPIRNASPEEVMFSDPTSLMYRSEEIKAISIAFPVYYEKKRIGVVGAVINMSEFGEQILSKATNAFPHTRRLLLGDNELVVAYYDKGAIGSSILSVSDTLGTKRAIELQKSNKESQDIVEMVSKEGLEGLVALHSFEVWDGVYWTMFNFAPYDELLAELHSTEINIIVILLITMVIVNLLVVGYVKFIMQKDIRMIYDGLKEFFAFLKYERNDVAHIAVDKGDELGKMAKRINEAVVDIKAHMEIDNMAISQAIDSVHKVEQGDLTIRLKTRANNPNLLKLQDILNELLDVLQKRVGSDMNLIHDVFEQYKRLDFTSQIPNAKGNVEITANVLGKEMSQMLAISSGFAQRLTQEAQTLQEAVNNLTNLTNSQASSLEQTAQAVEEITASMQNVSG
ncbi:chemotaxis protein, partial [Helicobacter marmotae]